MFFVLSKILHFLLDPLIWIIILFIWGFLTRKTIRKKRLLITAFSLLLFFTNPFIINELLQWWEVPSVKKENIDKNYEAGIVLGGMIKFYNSEMDRANFGAGADRLMQAVDLYNSNKIDKIIITGGSGKLGEQKIKEAFLIEKLLKEINISDRNILTESDSRNTYENAQYTAELIKEKNLRGPYLLITSAFHMRRSLAVFKKAGIDAEPYPADVLSGKTMFTPDKLIIPSADAIIGWNVLMHEWIGFLVYKVMGYA